MVANGVASARYLPYLVSISARGSQLDRTRIASDRYFLSSRRYCSHFFGSTREWIASEPLVGRSLAHRNEIRQIRVFRG